VRGSSDSSADRLAAAGVEPRPAALASRLGCRLAARTGLVCLLFTLLVAGLFAPDRGFVQDELWLLSAVRAAPDFAHSLVLRDQAWRSQPQRLLLPLPFALAARSGFARDFLQLASCLVWFGTALLAGVLAWQYFDRRPVTAFLAAGLTASATGDLTLNKLHALPAYLSVLAFLAALAALLRFRQRGGWVWLAGSLVCLLGGLFTYDAPLAAALATPALLAVLAGRLDRPLLAVAATWYAALVPYLALLARSLFTPGTHASVVLEPVTPVRHGLRALWLFGWNFAPWHWAAIFSLPGELSPPDALPELDRALASGLGVAVLLLLLRRFEPGSGAAPWRVARVATLLVVAFLSNASMALLNDLRVPFRSQLVSRVFVSIALAALLDAALSRFPRGRAALWLLLGLQVGLGLNAGLASQDFGLSLWRRQRRELGSIIETVAAVRPGVNLLLQIPAGAPSLATFAPEVGSHWLSLLAPDVRALIWNGGTGKFNCTPEARGFVCRNPTHAEDYQSGRRKPWILPFETTLLMVYVPDEGRFRLEPRLPSGWTWERAAEPLPAAAQLIRSAQPSRAAEQMLGRPELLGRWFPSRQTGLYLPLFSVQDEQATLDPSFAAPGGLEIRDGRQQAVLRQPGPVLTGVLWSAAPHRVALRCRVSGFAGRLGRWELSLRAGSGLRRLSAAALSPEPVLEAELERGRNEFTVSLQVAGPELGAAWGCFIVGVA